VQEASCPKEQRGACSKRATAFSLIEANSKTTFAGLHIHLTNERHVHSQHPKRIQLCFMMLRPSKELQCKQTACRMHKTHGKQWEFLSFGIVARITLQVKLKASVCDSAFMHAFVFRGSGQSRIRPSWMNRGG
jgi:hypothetical protein